MTSTVTAEPLTTAAYYPYGDVLDLDALMAMPTRTAPTFTANTSAPLVIKANQGTAIRVVHIAELLNLRPDLRAANIAINPDDKGNSAPQPHTTTTPTTVTTPAQPNLSFFRCAPRSARPFPAELLERHPYSTQVFIPVYRAADRLVADGADRVLAGTVNRQCAYRYLVVVALNGKDDRPDVSTLRAFVAHRWQGVSYRPGVWHHPMIVLEQETDFITLIWENGAAGEDCQVEHLAAPVLIRILESGEQQPMRPKL
ncbi:Allantoicase [Tieghemiomyces parasiticus]|uniref:Allantoicase n=1 Tax=Tieghemiomyces parasiticus TaxID=78921 RepID=A0A9W8DW48_9FUNG|nr:Allantoicase [Tieghemiomyces parasiticus]